MKRIFKSTSIWLSGLLTLTCLCALSATPAYAQNDDGGFAVSEDDTAKPPPAREDDSARPAAPREEAATQGKEAPVRMARICYLNGTVRWRINADADWSSASLNLPLRQGAQIWIERKGRAELQFDDGSVLRLGSAALATLQVMYSDTEGTFTEIKLQEGLASLRLRHNKAVYQIDTPFASLKAKGPAKIRTGVSASVEFAVRDGEATVEGGQGSQTIRTGDYLRLSSAMSNYKLYSSPGKDTWDYWNEDRDRAMDDGALLSNQYVPANVTYMSTEMDQYGTWESDSTYGHVWHPRVAASWRPYSDGQWVWVEPFGWTWVSNEPWGWTPYHYGTWVHRPYGWAWCPGARYQPWCPAPVHFCHYRDTVVWAPISPDEIVYYTPSPYCERMHNYFSITLAVVFAPERNHCYARPYNSTYINQRTYVTNYVTNNYVTNNFNSASPRTGQYAADKLNYTPRNMRLGGVSIGERDFGNRNTHNPFVYNPSGNDMLQRFNPVQSRGELVAGPNHIQPSATSVTSMKVMERVTLPRQDIAARPVYRAPLPNRVETSLAPQARTALKAEDRKFSTQNPTITTSPRVVDRTPVFGRPTERTTQHETPPVNRNSDSAAETARRARNSVGAPSSTTDSPRRTEAPVARDTDRRNSPPATPNRDEPRRESPRPVERPQRQEAPHRESPPQRQESPRPVERQDLPRRESPPQRQESPRPVERQDPPRRESPPPQRQEAPAPRRESPPPRQESPRPVERPQRQEVPRRESPPPQRQEPPRKDKDRKP